MEQEKDIVDELRREAKEQRFTRYTTLYAANEIERLREEVDRAHKEGWKAAKLDEARPVIHQVIHTSFVKPKKVRLSCVDTGEYKASLTVGKVYNAESAGDGLVRLIDDSGEDYLFPMRLFAVTQPPET